MQNNYFNWFSSISGADIIVRTVLLLLLLLSIYSWFIIFGKYRAVRKKNKLVVKLRQLLKSPKIDLNKVLENFQVIKNNSYTSILKFLENNKDILFINNKVNQVITDTVYNFLYDMNQDVESRITGLATIGNSATFIGLFGTVIGIINSFSSIGIASSTSLSVIAPGISEALYTTAFGLFVAIPASFGYNYFYNKIENYKEQQSILVQEMIYFFIKSEITKSKSGPIKKESKDTNSPIEQEKKIATKLKKSNN